MMGRPLMFLSVICCCSAAYAAGARAAVTELHPQPLPAAGPALDAKPSAGPASGHPSASPAEDELVREEDELRAAVSRRLQMLAAELEAEGFRSIGLIDHLGALAELYQELGDHLLAIGALDWALQLNRVHNGLYSLDDAALLEPMIASVTAMEDYESARSLEQRLVELTFRNPDDPRVTLILAGSAQRRLREAQRILEDVSSGGQFTFAIGAASADDMAEQSVLTRRREALASLRAARWQFGQAIAAGVRNGGYAVLDLLELEEQMLSTFFLEMSHPELAPEQSGRLCAQGEAVIENSVGNVSRFRESPTAAASTLIKLADWRLLCSNNGSALDTYDRAYASLVEKGAPADVVDELLSPQIPAAIPASFLDASTDTEADDDYRGYVDVSFVVGKYGTARNVEIIGASPGTTRAVERDVRAHVAQNRFRPRFVDGEPARAERVAIRYYYR